MPAIDLPIRTERLTLRPFTPGDLDDLYAYQSREDVTRYLLWGARTRDEVAEALRARLSMTSLERDGDRVVLAVDLDGRVIGDVMLGLDSLEHRGGEFGYVFHPDVAGHGYASEAAVEMLRLGFERVGLHRVVGRADARNAASCRLMERLGLRREAHFVQNELIRGEWTDEVVYAVLAAEWADRRTRGAAVRLSR